MVIEETVTELQGRIIQLEKQMESLISKRSTESSVGALKLLKAEVNHLAFALGWVNIPQLYFASMPVGSFNLPSLFESQSAPVVRTFERPEEVRKDGFGFYSADFASKIVDGLARQVVLNSQARRITTDGKVSALFQGGDNFLGWGLRSHGWGVSEEAKKMPLRINSLVLIESAYNFVRLAKDVMSYGIPPNQDVTFLIGYEYMKNAAGGPMLLNGKADRQMALHPHVPSDSDSFESKIVAPWSDSPGHTTLRLVSQLYHHFNLTDDQVPYTAKDDSGLVIDPALF